MIKKRSKPQRVSRLIVNLNDAERALCLAALTNVLTGRGDEWLRGIIRSVRSFREEAERKAGDFREEVSDE